MDARTRPDGAEELDGPAEEPSAPESAPGDSPSRRAALLLSQLPEAPRLSAAGADVAIDLLGPTALGATGDDLQNWAGSINALAVTRPSEEVVDEAIRRLRLLERVGNADRPSRPGLPDEATMDDVVRQEVSRLGSWSRNRHIPAELRGLITAIHCGEGPRPLAEAGRALRLRLEEARAGGQPVDFGAVFARFSEEYFGSQEEQQLARERKVAVLHAALARLYPRLVQHPALAAYTELSGGSSTYALAEAVARRHSPDATTYDDCTAAMALDHLRAGADTYGLTAEDIGALEKTARSPRADGMDIFAAARDRLKDRIIADATAE